MLGAPTTTNDNDKKPEVIAPVPSGQEEVLPLTLTPGSGTFQHFLDGALPKIAAALPLLWQRPKVKILIACIPGAPVVDILGTLGLGPERILCRTKGRPTASWKAGHIYIVCKAPPHPLLYARARHVMFRQQPMALRTQLVGGAGIAGSAAGIAGNQPTFVYLSRSGGAGHRRVKSVRRVINENELLAALRPAVLKGGLVLDTTIGIIGKTGKATHKTRSMAETLQYFRSARAIMGPHGGALYNIVFCEPGTLLFEIASCPSKAYSRSHFGHFVPLERPASSIFPKLGIWTQATYVRVVGDVDKGSNDYTVNALKVAKAVGQRVVKLGLRRERREAEQGA